MIKESLQEFHNKLQVSATIKGIPVYGGFELTPRCNLNCKMCYVKINTPCNELIKGELTTEQWVKLGQYAADNGALSIFLTGGEPIIRNDFKDIYIKYNKLGLRISFFTNGSLITEEFVKWLAQTPPASVDVTIYGASDDTYFKLCGQKVYQKVINGIELLLKYNINTRIKTTIVRSNINDYEKIQEITKSYGLEFLSTSIINGNRNNGIKNIENERLSPEEIYNFTLKNLDEHECKNVDIEQLRNSQKNIPPMFCSAGKSSFFINWKGEMVPCPLLEKPFTKPLETGYKKAWDILRVEIEKIPGNNECKHCDSRIFCPVCPGRLYLETGKYDGHSDYVCRLAKEKEKLFKLFNYEKGEILR